MTPFNPPPNQDGKSPRLDPEADEALGMVSPELAWLQVGYRVRQFVDAYPDLAATMGRAMDLQMDYEDLDVLLQEIDPIVGINQLHYIQSDLNLQDLDHQPGAKVLEGVIKIFTISDRMLRYL
jgi:hypothetical protein